MNGSVRAGRRNTKDAKRVARKEGSWLKARTLVHGRRCGKHANSTILRAVTRAEKARRIVEILERLYPTVPIPLDHSDAFTLLVAVVLSAQTTDKKVNQVTPALFAEAGTPQKLAALPVPRIHALIREVGLAPQKAKHLSGLASLIVSRHDGQVPQTFEELEALPGVGHKTASVVMAQAFGVAAFPVDTHIHRLAERWGLSDGTSVTRTEEDLKRTFDRSLWNGLHLRIIYFGREHCPALRHDAGHCLICGWAGKKRASTSARPSASASPRGASASPSASARPRGATNEPRAKSKPRPKHGA